MNATQNNVANARNWLLAMGAAAKQLGLTIQVCMRYRVFFFYYCDDYYYY